MRRVLGFVLIGVAVFAAVLAVLLPTVVVPASKKTPLDLNITQISSGPAKVRDAKTNELRDVQLRATRVVRTDSHASDSKDTTVNESLCIVIIEGSTPNCVPSTDPRLLSVTTDRVTADRKNAESVHVGKYNENVNGDTSARHVGLSYKWPIDAKKKTYQFYQPDVKKAFPAVYKGTKKVRGLTTYEYFSDTGTQAFKIAGLFDGTYSDTRTVWVEPRTGTIVDGLEHQVLALPNGDIVLDTTLRFEKSAINFQSNYAKDKINKLKQAQLWGPLILGIVAIVALIGGVLLLRPRGRAGEDEGGVGRHGTPPPPWQPNYAEPSDYAGSSQT